VFQQSCFSIYVSACFTFVLQHLCSHLCCNICVCFQQSCFSNYVFSICDSAFVFQYLRFTFVLQQLFSHLCCSSCVCFQQSCFSNYVFSICDSTFVFQYLRFTFVLQQLFSHLFCSSSHLCCGSLHLYCSVFSTSILQSIAINDNLDHLRHLCCSHISNTSAQRASILFYLPIERSATTVHFSQSPFSTLGGSELHDFVSSLSISRLSNLRDPRCQSMLTFSRLVGASILIVISPLVTPSARISNP
jgi:hypothetical protein